MGNSSTHDEAEIRPDVLVWRGTRLQRAGFDPETAHRLARDERLDFHALLELIDRDCPPRLAARIVTPLDDGSDAS
jgi:hypothetical protein